MIKLATTCFVVAALGCATGCATKLGNTAKSAEAAPHEAEPNSDRSSRPPSNNWICSHPSQGLRYNFDASAAPELAVWMRKKLMPTVVEWYPKIVEMFSTEGCEVPKEVSFKFHDDDNKSVVATTHGSKVVSFNRRWVHDSPEMLDVPIAVIVRTIAAGKYPNGPDWVRAGITRYFSSYHYARNLHGDIKEPDLTSKCATYDSSEFPEFAASFLNFVETRHQGTVRELNALCRQGKYDEATYWKKRTGRTVKELEKEWKAPQQQKDTDCREQVMLNVKIEEGDDVWTSPCITARSGDRGVYKVVTEYIFPTGYNLNFAETNGVCSWTSEPKSWTNQEVGVIIEAKPTVVEGMVDLKLKVEIVDEPQWKDFGYTATDPSGTKQEVPMEQPFFKKRVFENHLLLRPDVATTINSDGFAITVTPKIVGSAQVCDNDGVAAKKAIQAHVEDFGTTPHRRFRFSVDAPRSDGDSMQISEIELLDEKGAAIPRGAYTIAYDSSTIPENDDEPFPDDERPENAVDGDRSTKWLDWRAGLNETDKVRAAAWLEFRFKTATTVYGYRWYTANDEPGRTPVSWTLSASDDEGATWRVLDKVEDYETTSESDALAYEIVPRQKM